MNNLEKEINNNQIKWWKLLMKFKFLKQENRIRWKRKYAIEVGDSKQKIIEIQHLLEEAKIEYDDRLNRFKAFQTEIDLLSSKLHQVAFDITENRQAFEENNSILRRLQNRKDVLKNIIKEPFNNQAGVKAIVDNKSSLNGVLGVVGQVLMPQNGYEEAISVAIGGALYNIVTTDESSARNAINF